MRTFLNGSVIPSEGEIIVEGNTFLPYDFFDPLSCVDFIEEKCHHIKHSLKMLEKTKGHIYLTCPVAGERLMISATEVDIKIIDGLLIQRSLYSLDKPLS